MYTEKALEDVLNATFTAIAKLSRHRYFSDELWIKLGKWDHNDKADIQAAFVSKYIYERTHLPTCPVGLKWVHICKEEQALSYFHEYDKLWDDYIKWCNEQR